MSFSSILNETGLARAANVPEATPTFLGHRSPLLEKHSKKLTDIPANLYAVLNGRGKTKKITAQEVSGVTRAKESLTKKPVQPT